MSKIVVSFILIFLSINLYSQKDKYKVIKVNGSILFEKNNTELKRGSVFSENDKLNFKTTNSRAAVINPIKGRFILMPNNNNIAFARANLTPSMNNISSRAGALINKIDLSNFFNNNYVILDKSYIKISPKVFKMDDNNFFYIKYTYKGEEIPKKLKNKGDTLIIDKKELFTIDGWPIPNPNITNMDLMYLNKLQNKSVFISTFNPVFPDTKELLEEIKLIIDNLKNKSRENKITEVTSYINEMYGKIDKNNVEIWLINNNVIK